MERRIEALGVVMLCVPLLSACTTSLVVSGDPQDLKSNEVVNGMSYRLPVRTFKLTVTHSLEECGAPVYVAGPTADKVKAGLSVKTSIKVEGNTIPGETLTVTYLEASNWVKTSKIDIKTYDNGILKSVNASITDKSSEILESAISTGFKMARLAAGLPPSVAEKAPEDATQFTFCSDRAKAMLANRKRAKDGIEAKTKDLEKLQTELESLKLTALIGGLSEQQKIRVAEIIKDSDQLTNAIKALQKELDELVRRTSTSFEVLYTPIWDELAAGKLLYQSPDKVLKQLRPLLSECAVDLVAGNKDKEVCNSESQGSAWADAWSLWVSRDLDLIAVFLPLEAGSTERVSAEMRKRLVTDLTSLERNPGIRFRRPVLARLKICSAALSVIDCKQAVDPIATQDVTVPQLGSWQSLPLVNGFGQDNSISASWTQDGIVTEQSFEDKSARGLKAVSALDSAVSGSASFKETQRAEKEKNKAAADVEATKDATAEYDKQIAIKEKELKLLQIQESIDMANDGQKSEERINLEAEVAILGLKKQKVELIQAIRGTEKP